jgi:hypothetical protein
MSRLVTRRHVSCNMTPQRNETTTGIVLRFSGSPPFSSCQVKTTSPVSKIPVNYARYICKCCISMGLAEDASAAPQLGLDLVIHRDLPLRDVVQYLTFRPRDLLQPLIPALFRHRRVRPYFHHLRCRKPDSLHHNCHLSKRRLVFKHIC